ncbi:autotransporter domain-containing protein [Fusobacterium nucleatum subsp. nucleatum ATCC 23726]|uniref:Autotransporter beta-domain protein n=1 Tax=Fusobacterium nucleatum subsp. nucleatum (strain ATCC 23726 / VPI 4351) TaxID=525283 RepID=D5RE96_FUSN2|nr:autotransporter outer membrane beta-barrel domain-containing protein [Fusobacterium nucleatum]AVQ23784.1 autotransporter domain-containing protein [Fusobacterium nucleatum subsp. nucleatum ATCC 23726]EFG94861.1 autotransporter beta-domain protein [Fusobacterium nucleatum subsp. nucleatum ATCC 23726]
MKIKRLIMILLIVAATVSYADERTDTIKQIDKIIDNAITKAIESDKTNPYLKQSRIKSIKEQILSAIKKDLDEPGLTRLDIPEILPKIDKEIKKIGDGIGPKNNYRIIQESKEVIQPVEQTAYEGFLRVVDTQNRMNGVKSNYWEKGNVKAQRTHNGVDLVPIAHVVYENAASDLREEPNSNSKIRRSSHTIADLAEKGIGAFTKEDYSELAYKNSNQFYEKRFYFGAGNTVKDIIFLNKEKFSSEVENTKKNKNERYYIEGEYKLVTTNATEDERSKSFGAEKDVNPLDITMKEYRTRIEGKSKAEISAFLKEKMAQKNIKNVIQEGEDLYTVDSKGRKWKVDWKLEPVSVESGSKTEYKDTVFTTINYYSPFDDKSTTDNRGKLLYTKDGSIYAQDKNKYTNDVNLKLTETETKVETKIKKMLKLTKNKYGPFEGISKADFDAKRSEYTDPTKYDYYYDDDDERYYVSKITRISKEFETTDTKSIEEFKKYAQNLVEENINKEIKENVKVKKDVTKSLNDFIATAKERVEKGEAPRNQFDQYFYDKKHLSKEDFENKWVKPFKNPEYIKAKENYERELAETTAKRDEAEKAKDKYTKITDTLFDKITQNVGRGVISYTDFYEDTITKTLISEAKLEQLINSKPELNTEEKKNLVREYYKEWKNFENSSKIFYTLNSQVESGIAKKYGFWDNPAATPEQRKYVGLNGLIKDLDLTRSIAGKNIEFRGIGRIEGTVDLGEGKNTLKIAEQMTGQYGTNITLGAYAKLKNIDTVEVGGSLTLDNAQASISGRTSLRMDIDATKKNSEGHYYQHALKDSDPNIRFIKYGTTNMDSRNDFMIELLTSKITENEAIIDMGRKIDYTWHDIKTGKDYDMTIPFVSDSIAHQLINNKKLSKNGTSLLELKTREELRRLNSDENAVYRSIRNANKLGILSPTLTTTNKKTTFNTVDQEKEAKKKKDLLTYLKTKTDEELVNDLSQFNLSETEKKEALELVKKLKNSDDFKSIMNKEKELKTKLDEINKLEKDSNYQRLHFQEIIGKIESDFNGLSNKVYSLYPNAKDLEKQFEIDLKREDPYTLVRKAVLLADKIPELKTKLDSIKNELKTKLNDTRELLKKDLATIKELKAKYPNSKFGDIEKTIETILSGDNLERMVLSSRDYNKNSDLADLVSDFKKLASDISLQLKEKEDIEKALKENDASIEQPRYADYHRLKSKIFYTMREEEVLSELKNMLNQLSDRNIYSKLNKISKNEISTYTTIPFEVTHALTDKKNIARGGFISNRTVQDNFKGNIYTAYGLYETTANSNTKYGILFGGANTKHNEVYQRSLTTVATESEIKGVSAYVGGYFNKPVINNLNWITGIGTQYGRYKVKREMRNNYQDLHSEGKVNTASLNTYSGFIINYPIQEDVFVQLKGLLAYTMIKQSKINESGDLPLDINGKTYHYVDGEAGISFNKIFYGEDLKSSISAGAYGILGLSGYKNANMEAKINGSSSSFGIKGDRVKRDAIKIHLDYNVQTDVGYTYGLEGTYITNSKENNVKIGIKGGYVF